MVYARHIFSRLSISSKLSLNYNGLSGGRGPIFPQKRGKPEIIARPRLVRDTWIGGNVLARGPLGKARDTRWGTPNNRGGIKRERTHGWLKTPHRKYINTRWGTTGLGQPKGTWSHRGPQWRIYNPSAGRVPRGTRPRGEQTRLQDTSRSLGGTTPRGERTYTRRDDHGEDNTPR